jgi:DNA-binding MurR/RpiR family transcriptional regulator
VIARGTSKSRKTGRRGASCGAALETLIREAYDRLPASERKVADFMLDYPGELATFSATEIAAKAESSKAAVTRMLKRLGFENFNAVRQAAREARRWGSPVYLLGKELGQQGFSTKVKRHIEQDFNAISDTFDMLDEQSFQDAVSRISTAARVYVLGFRNSHFLAAYLRWQLIQVRDNVELLPVGGETLGEHLAGLSRDDAVILVAFRRRMPVLEEAMDIVARAKCFTLFVTDPTARNETSATFTVRCESRGDDLFDYYTAAMSFLHFLSVSVVAEIGHKGRDRLKRIEAIHEELREFG